MTTMTIRRTFDVQLEKLQEEVLALSGLVEEALLEAVKQLRLRDLAASRQLVERDKAIDEQRYAIESHALMLIATQQPMAGDMRMIAASLFIANELERIGDYAKGIAKVNIKIGSEPLIKPLVDLPRMAQLAQQMIHRSLAAYVQRDVVAANVIIVEDDKVDALHDQVYAELMTLIMQDPSKMRQANLLLMASHNLERAADRATNICERVIYAATGKFIDAGWEEDGD